MISKEAQADFWEDWEQVKQEVSPNTRNFLESIEIDRKLILAIRLMWSKAKVKTLEFAASLED